MATKIDWTIVEAEYITGNTTADALATKYGVSVSTVRHRCRKGKWKEKRNANRAEESARHAKRMAAEARRRAQEGIASLMETATNVAQKADAISRKAEDATTPADVKAMAEALGRLVSVYRQIGGLLSPAEQSAREIGLAQVKLHERRLELEQRKMEQDTADVAEIVIAGEAGDYAD